MYRIRLRSGEEAVYQTIHDLTAGVQSGAVTPDASIYHARAEKWLPINMHPHFQLAAGTRQSHNGQTVPRPRLGASPPGARGPATGPRPAVQVETGDRLTASGPRAAVPAPAPPSPAKPQPIQRASGLVDPAEIQLPPEPKLTASGQRAAITLGSAVEVPVEAAVPTTAPQAPLVARTKTKELQFLELGPPPTLPPPPARTREALVPPSQPPLLVPEVAPPPPIAPKAPEKVIGFLNPIEMLDPAGAHPRSAPGSEPGSHVLDLPYDQSERRPPRASGAVPRSKWNRRPALAAALAGVALLGTVATLAAWQPWRRVTRSETTAPTAPRPVPTAPTDPTATAPQVAAVATPAPPRPGAVPPSGPPAPQPAPQVQTDTSPKALPAVLPAAPQVDVGAMPLDVKGVALVASTGTAAGAGATVSLGELAKRYGEAYAKAQARLEQRVSPLRFADLFGPGRLAEAGRLVEARRSVSQASSAISQYLAGTAAIERAYEDTVLLRGRQQKVTPEELRAWAARGSQQDSKETTQLTELMLKQIDNALSLLVVQHGKYEFDSESITFKDPQAAKDYAALRTWIMSQRDTWARTPEAALSAPVKLLLNAIGKKGLPQEKTSAS